MRSQHSCRRDAAPWAQAGRGCPARRGRSDEGSGGGPRPERAPRQAAAAPGAGSHPRRLAVARRLGAGVLRPRRSRLSAPLELQRDRGFVVCWYFVFLVVYGAVVAVANPRHIVVERLVAATLYLVAALVVFALATTLIYTFAEGWRAFVHPNFFTHDMAGVATTAPLNQGGIFHAIVGHGDRGGDGGGRSPCLSASAPPST